MDEKIKNIVTLYQSSVEFLQTEVVQTGVVLDYLAFTFKPEFKKAFVSHNQVGSMDMRYKLPIDYLFDLFGDNFKRFVDMFGEYRHFGTNHYGASIKVSVPKDCPSGKAKAKGYSVDFLINYCFPDDPNQYDFAFKMGVNISIPSHFVKTFIKLLGFDPDDLKYFFKWLLDHDCKCSRIDLCWDDFSMRYTPHDYNIENCCNNLVTRCSKHGFISSKQKEGGTFYLGSKDTKYMRIYDKNYESGGAIPSVRYEVMYTGNFAKLLHVNLVKCGLEFDFADLIINDWFRIVGKPYIFNFDTASLETRKEWYSFIKDSFANSCSTINVKNKVSNKELAHYNLKMAESHFVYVQTFYDVFGYDATLSMLQRIRAGDKRSQSLLDYDKSLIASCIKKEFCDWLISDNIIHT